MALPHADEHHVSTKIVAPGAGCGDDADAEDGDGCLRDGARGLRIWRVEGRMGGWLGELREGGSVERGE